MPVSLIVILAWIGLLLVWLGAFLKRRGFAALTFLGIGLMLPMIVQMFQSADSAALGLPATIAPAIANWSAPLACQLSADLAICQTTNQGALETWSANAELIALPAFYLLLLAGLVFYFAGAAPRREY